MKSPRQYRIKLMTQIGPITVNYFDSQPLHVFESEILAKYGHFITLSAEEVI